MEHHNFNLIYIIGSPRSGTTWLQSILSDHSKVASTIETKTFPDYIFPLERAYQSELVQSKKINWPFGLPQLFSEDEFNNIVRFLIRSIYSKIHSKNKEATYILEKHPLNIHYSDTILKYLPSSKFIHIIRDGREVIVSMMNANRKVGFGEKYIMAAAERWKKAVLDGLLTKKLTDQYIEIRYESLLDNPYAEVNKIIKFLQLDDEECVSDIIMNNQFEVAKKTLKSPDKGVSFNSHHFNSAKKDSWKEKLKVYEKYMIDIVAGDLLIKLGYANEDWWYSNSIEKYTIPIYVFFLRVLRRINDTIKFGLSGIF